MNDIEDLCDQIFKLQEQIPKMLKAAYMEGVTDASDCVTDDFLESMYKGSQVAVDVGEFLGSLE